jgi:tyrosine-protein phosphatase SIW14
LASTTSKNVLNLRRFNLDKHRSKRLDLNIRHMPIKTRKMTEADLVDALDFIDDTHYNTIVHCKHGSDRTGAVIAAYHVIYNNWSKESAIEEMRNPKFGYHEKLFPNLVGLIENLDIEGVRDELGMDQ